mgnify:CR=1 FL=1
MDISWAELLLMLLVGMGPFKAMLVFVEKTEHYEQRTRDKVAAIAVATAVGSGLLLLLLGSSLQALLHFSLGALSLSGGIILLVVSVRLVLDTGTTDEDEEQDPVDLAVSPLGLPLILNPVGIVALVTFSAESSGGLLAGKVALAVLAMGLIDLLVLLVAGRVGTLIPHPVIGLLEKLFSILVAALAVQIMVEGALELGII